MKFEIRISPSSQPLCIVRTSSDGSSLIIVTFGVDPVQQHIWCRDIYETEGEGMHFNCGDIRQHSAGF